MNTVSRLSLILACWFLPGGLLADSLEDGFRNPPDSAKPHTWWHWMNGNITREGITADLEAMKRVGVSGAQIFNVDCGIPHGPVQFMSSEWRALFKHAIQEANRLGLEICVHNCAGWSSSGGPWNTPQHAMQRVVTSEVRVHGPAEFNDRLPQPLTNLGFYRDIAVLAFPLPESERRNVRDAAPVATISGDEAPGNKLFDGKSDSFVRLPAPSDGHPVFAQLEFTKPFPTRTVKIVGGPGIQQSEGVLQVSDDGNTFRALQSFAFGRRASSTQVLTLGQEVTARCWRVQFTKAADNARNVAVAEIELSPRLIIENIDAKAGFNGAEVRANENTEDSGGETILRDSIINLTAKLQPDGRLNWSAPPGDWVVLRIGHTPTGRNNHPAPKEGEGPECDKLSKAALDAHWDGFMQKILDDVGPLAGRTLNNALVDSYEVGGQNWTENFREEFQKRRGYDLLPFLPTFTARVVDTPEVSERFLWDVRRTIADLMAENYYGHFARLCRQHGLMTSIEPYTGPFESLQCGAPADIVMGEFWSGSQGNRSVKIASSVAHIYGKTIVGAESFTAAPGPGRWQNTPWSFKALGDLMYCQGLNRYIFHRYAHQPWMDRLPGMTMGQWGFHFERTSTWFELSRAWLEYVARCQFLLQQGRAVADVAYFCGESAPVEMRAGNPPCLEGFDWDAVNADVLLHGSKVKNGRLTLRSGANYAVLVLPPDDRYITAPTMRRIRDLVRSGMTVLGPRPEGSPSLSDFPAGDEEVKAIALQLWGGIEGNPLKGSGAGKGNIITGKPLDQFFSERRLKPDFEYQSDAPGAKLAYAHRTSSGAEIYFVSNQRECFESADCTFRISGKTPERWHPDTGVIESAPVWYESAGRTVVPLQLEPAGSVFVVFRSRPRGDHVVAADTDVTAPAETAPTIEIRRAVYEAPGGEGSMDVTARLAEQARGGQVRIMASNDTFGSDPAPNIVKRLQVDYVLDGQPDTITVNEGEMLALPKGLHRGEPPTWEMIAGDRGVISVKAWRDCRVQMRTARRKLLQAEVKDVAKPEEIAGVWSVSFPPGWNAPARAEFDRLISWTELADPGVKYFSGTATYDKTIEITGERLRPGHELWLDLGEVKNFAEVSLNGHALGILWKPPFRVNITPAARPGANRLQVKITNLWPNRLIGDEQLPADVEWNGKQLKEWPQWLLDGKPSPNGRLTFTTWHHWTKDDALLPSGLLGPVTLRSAQIVAAE